MSAADLEKAFVAATNMLTSTRSYTEEQLRQVAEIAVENLRMMARIEGSQASPEVSVEELLRKLEEAIRIKVGAPGIIESDEGHKPWLPSRRAELTWSFWRRYERYLQRKTDPLPVPVVAAVDRLTDTILERLEDPIRPGSWDRRGMVVGHVQSGKTANFIGLICKAADAGYRILIVLTGIHENLRSQTQLRVDEGFLGYTSAHATKYSIDLQKVGVGTLLSDVEVSADTLTGFKADFNKARTGALGISPIRSDPLILVVKKNSSVLENILRWVLGYALPDPADPRRVLPISQVPLLMIDDEADNASINTAEIPIDENTGRLLNDYDVTKINGRIRQILNMFSRRAYIGYTATPFANIFIDPEDYVNRGEVGGRLVPYGNGLFPRSFIINLPAPDNYVGPALVFGIGDDQSQQARNPLPIVRIVPDEEVESFVPRRHSIDFRPQTLPPSLREAVLAFLLSSAVRDVRKAGGHHHSMLVHVTRFKKVQQAIRDLLQSQLTAIRNSLRYGDGDSSHSVESELRQLWDADFCPATAAICADRTDLRIEPVSWEAVKARLVDVTQRAQVKSLNGESSDVLDYHRRPEGVTVITIGGDKLSRGLTLEGLSVSYFLRASRMYDTLMQMGRWFGYRPGYLDVCRLYTTDELEGWYRAIAVASEELRSEFDYMADIAATPDEYGLKVRSDIESLLITSIVKMRTAKTLEVTYEGRICETTVFFGQEAKANSNLATTKRFLDGIRDFKSKTHLWMWSEVPAAKVIEFLSQYETHPMARLVSGPLLVDFIRDQLSKSLLRHWTVRLLQGSASSSDLLLGVKLVERNSLGPAESNQRTSIKRLLDPGHEDTGLTPAQMAEALRLAQEDWDRWDPTSSRRTRPRNRPTTTDDITGRWFRKVRSLDNGLLLIYPLDPTKLGLSHLIPVVGIGVSFPGDRFHPSSDSRVRYEANKVYLRSILDEEDVDP